MPPTLRKRKSGSETSAVPVAGKELSKKSRSSSDSSIHPRPSVPSVKKNHTPSESSIHHDGLSRGLSHMSHSSVHARPCAFNNFSKLMKKEGPSRVRSSPIKIGSYKFQIDVYPRGRAGQTEGYVSIYIVLLEPSKARITSTVSILLDTEKKFCAPVGTDDYDLESHINSYGWVKYIEQDALMDLVLAFTNDQLILLLEIFDLDVPGFSHQLRTLGRYEKLLNSEEFSDVKLIVGGETIYAHKMILSNGNEVFTALFKGKSKENKNNVFKIEDVDYEVMLELIRFIYTGQIRNIERMPKKLIVAADKYGVDELKDQCGSYLSQILSINNVLENISFADVYGVDRLKESAITFFMNHKKNIAKITDFKTRIQTLEPDLLADLMADLIES